MGKPKDRNYFINSDVTAEDVFQLLYHVRNDNSITKLSTAISTRLQAIEPGTTPDIEDLFSDLEDPTDVGFPYKVRKVTREEDDGTTKVINDSLLGAVAALKAHNMKKVSALLNHWPVWREWLVNVPGVGPYFAGNFILAFYYKFIPICRKCESEVELIKDEDDEKGKQKYYCPGCKKLLTRKEKGGQDRAIRLKVVLRDFATVSKWWWYLGIAVDPVRGKKLHRQEGVQCTWSPRLSTVCWKLGEQFELRCKMDNFYKKFFLEKKAKIAKLHPDSSKGHVQLMSRNETVQLFQSHFWHVARRLEGKEVYGPYAEVVLKHTGIIPPYYWDDSSYPVPEKLRNLLKVA
jgi:hypothetical protein